MGVNLISSLILRRLFLLWMNFFWEVKFRKQLRKMSLQQLNRPIYLLLIFQSPCVLNDYLSSIQNFPEEIDSWYTYERKYLQHGDWLSCKIITEHFRTNIFMIVFFSVHNFLSYFILVHMCFWHSFFLSTIGLISSWQNDLCIFILNTYMYICD